MEPYSKINDHEEQALSRFTSQYESAEVLKFISKNQAKGMQAIEDATWSFIVQKWLEDAEGVQLDRLGEIVGEIRLGKNDTDYRNSIRFKIYLNRNNGEPEVLLNFIRAQYDSDLLIYEEPAPASVLIFIEGPTVSTNDIQTLKTMLPAGVDLRLITTNLTPLGFPDVGEALPAGYLGFSDLEDDPMVGGVLPETKGLY